MPVAYILVKSTPGHDNAVLDDLKKVPYVTEVAWVNVAYDLVVKVNAPTREDIADVNFKHIRGITGVTDTLLMVAELYEEVIPMSK